MGSAASASPAPSARVVLQSMQARVSQLEAEKVVSEGSLGRLKECLEEALKVCPRGDTGSRASAAIQELSRQCVAIAEEAGLFSVAVAELLCEGLAAAAVADVLEPLGPVLDSFAVQIMASLWRLDENVQPEWSLERFGRPGKLCFADSTQPFQRHALDLRLHQGLQGVCAWVLALLVRAMESGAVAGTGSAAHLWDFVNCDALCAVIFGKSALCFQQGCRETACVRIPHDLPKLRRAVLVALLGLHSPTIAFHADADAEDVSMARRNEELLAHCALLAAVAQENGLLDTILAFDWAELALHLAADAMSGPLDATMMGASCVLLANAGWVSPAAAGLFVQHLSELPEDLREQVRGFICPASCAVGQARTEWLGFFGKAEDKRTAPPERAAGPTGLRELLTEVPPEFRCALDGRLLVDPVRAPSGRVYERSVLAAALERGDPRLHAGTPFALQESIIIVIILDRASLTPALRGLNRRLVPAAAVQRRFLNLHEYQAQEIFQKFGVGVPKNLPAFSVSEAVEKANEMPGDEVVVKAQVLAGGRGLGYFKENNFQGGVHIVPKAKVAEIAEKMLNKTLITKQTGEEGKPNNTLLLAEKVSIKDEKYFAILMDRASGGPLMIGSKTGGTSIEDIAAADPTAIIRTPVDIISGINMADAEKMATEMGFTGAQAKEAATLMANLYKVFMECDCTMLEINPLASLSDGRVLVCDSKVNFDDNAAYRQKDIHAKRDTSQENPIEVEAKKYDLNYIKLDGNVACMVNGAGLAMSTMDLLSILGGSPANFLDVGGASTVETMTMAFKIIMGDPNVKSIFVNIFGGIARCDHIAEAVVAGVKAIGGNDAIKPLVIRLEGTNVEAGMEIIKNSGVDAFLTNDFTTGAKKAVELASK
ncbi:unnamed protein product [Effrenium voratum]|nr:unnamed protein product [Effrenium voratum]